MVSSLKLPKLAQEQAVVQLLHLGMALAYKIGQLKIAELRQRAEGALGDDFDVKAFHGQVLGSGALPLDVLEAKIERWIASKQAEA